MQANDWEKERVCGADSGKLAMESVLSANQNGILGFNETSLFPSI